MRMKELTILDAKTMFTPLSSPSWQEEKTINELWPLRPDEFLPERTFQFDRYVSILMFARKLGNDGTSANLLEGNYLDEIAKIERTVATNVRFQLADDFQFANKTLLNRGKTMITFQQVCLNWHGKCYR
jgi:hypothetical protein